MNGHLPPAQPIPLTLEPCTPVTEDVYFVEQNDHPAMGACGRVCARPDAFPEARESSLRAVTRRIEGRRTGLPGEFQEERGLPHLARPSEELDPCRRVFGEAGGQETAAGRGGPQERMI